MYSNWNCNSHYTTQNYQDHAKSDYYSFSNDFAEEPAYITEEPENHDNDSYTFLPKPTLYDTIFDSTLDLTRSSTDGTESGEKSPLSFKTLTPQSGYMPNILTNMQNNIDVMANYLETSVDAYINSGNNDLITNTISHNECEDAPSVTSSSQKKGLLRSTLTVKIIPNSLKFENKEEATIAIEEESPVSESLESTQLKSLIKSNIWDEEKDEILTKLGVQYKCDWKKISKKFNHKKITPHFLKIRYKELICAPLQRRMKFDHKEDLMIAKYFTTYGSNWVQMSAHFKDRSPTMLKNRYYSFIRKRDLMDFLLGEVKNIERENQLVDDIKEQGSDCMSEEDSDKRDRRRVKKESGRKASVVSVDKNSEGIVEDLSSNIEINVEETIKRALKSESEKKIKNLEARVKSFQGLYLRAKAELKSLRSSVQDSN